MVTRTTKRMKCSSGDKDSNKNLTGAVIPSPFYNNINLKLKKK